MIDFPFQEWLKKGAIVSSGSKQCLIGCDFKANSTDALAIYTPDFFLENRQPWHFFKQWMECSYQAIAQSLNDCCSFPEPVWQDTPLHFFQRQFECIQQLFNSRTLQKAVPYVFSDTAEKMSKSRLQSILKYILSHPHPALSVYGYWDENQGVLGLTPEILFHYQLHQRQLKTTALAGTLPCSVVEEDFKQHLKEVQEHQFVVDGICQALMPLGEVNTQSTRLLKLAHFQHLATPIQATLNDSVEFEQLVRALHPTPALGAYPFLEGWQWLEGYQKELERGRYGAPFGFIHPRTKEWHCLVAIRNVQWNSYGMRIGAGCGVVKESDCTQEWEEIQLKLKTIRYLLCL